MNNYSFFSATRGSGFLIYLLVVLDLILRGLTLYKSAKRDQKIWFVALLVVNSLGILPIIYLIANKDILMMKKSALPKKVVKKTGKKSKR